MEVRALNNNCISLCPDFGAFLAHTVLTWENMRENMVSSQNSSVLLVRMKKDSIFWRKLLYIWDALLLTSPMSARGTAEVLLSMTTAAGAKILADPKKKRKISKPPFLMSG